MLHSLSEHELKEMFSLTRIVERDDIHVILPAVVSGLEPRELVSLSPCQEESLPIKVMIATPRGSYGFQTELAKGLGG